MRENAVCVAICTNAAKERLLGLVMETEHGFEHFHLDKADISVLSRQASRVAFPDTRLDLDSSSIDLLINRSHECLGDAQCVQLTTKPLTMSTPCHRAYL